MERFGGDGPELAHFIAINVTSALGILLVAGIMRLNGYGLYGRPVSE